MPEIVEGLHQESKGPAVDPKTAKLSMIKDTFDQLKTSVSNLVDVLEDFNKEDKDSKDQKKPTTLNEQAERSSDIVKDERNGFLVVRNSIEKNLQELISTVRKSSSSLLKVQDKKKLTLDNKSMEGVTKMASQAAGKPDKKASAKSDNARIADALSKLPLVKQLSAVVDKVKEGFKTAMAFVKLPLRFLMAIPRLFISLGRIITAPFRRIGSFFSSIGKKFSSLFRLPVFKLGGNKEKGAIKTQGILVLGSNIKDGAAYISSFKALVRSLGTLGRINQKSIERAQDILDKAIEGLSAMLEKNSKKVESMKKKSKSLADAALSLRQVSTSLMVLGVTTLPLRRFDFEKLLDPISKFSKELAKVFGKTSVRQMQQTSKTAEALAVSSKAIRQASMSLAVAGVAAAAANFTFDSIKKFITNLGILSTDLESLGKVSRGAGKSIDSIIATNVALRKAALAAAATGILAVAGGVGVKLALWFVSSFEEVAVKLDKMSASSKNASKVAMNIASTMRSLSAAAVASTLAMPVFITGAAGNVVAAVYLASFALVGVASGLASSFANAAVSSLGLIDGAISKLRETASASAEMIPSMLLGTVGNLTALLFLTLMIPLAVMSIALAPVFLVATIGALTAWLFTNVLLKPAINMAAGIVVYGLAVAGALAAAAFGVALTVTALSFLPLIVLAPLAIVASVLVGVFGLVLAASMALLDIGLKVTRFVAGDVDIARNTILKINSITEELGLRSMVRVLAAMPTLLLIAAMGALMIVAFSVVAVAGIAAIPAAGALVGIGLTLRILRALAPNVRKAIGDVALLTLFSIAFAALGFALAASFKKFAECGELISKYWKEILIAFGVIAAMALGLAALSLIAIPALVGCLVLIVMAGVIFLLPKLLNMAVDEWIALLGKTDQIGAIASGLLPALGRMLGAIALLIVPAAGALVSGVLLLGAGFLLSKAAGQLSKSVASLSSISDEDVNRAISILGSKQSNSGIFALLKAVRGLTFQAMKATVAAGTLSIVAGSLASAMQNFAKSVSIVNIDLPESSISAAVATIGEGGLLTLLRTIGSLSSVAKDAVKPAANIRKTGASLSKGMTDFSRAIDAIASMDAALPAANKSMMSILTFMGTLDKVPKSARDGAKTIGKVGKQHKNFTKLARGITILSKLQASDAVKAAQSISSLNIVFESLKNAAKNSRNTKDDLKKINDAVKDLDVATLSSIFSSVSRIRIDDSAVQNLQSLAAGASSLDTVFKSLSKSKSLKRVKIDPAVAANVQSLAGALNSFKSVDSVSLQTEAVQLSTAIDAFAAINTKGFNSVMKDITKSFDKVDGSAKAVDKLTSSIRGLNAELTKLNDRRETIAMMNSLDASKTKSSSGVKDAKAASYVTNNTSNTLNSTDMTALTTLLQQFYNAYTMNVNSNKAGRKVSF